MKFSITEQTPKLLKLQLKPQAFFYWLFGGLFASAGIFMMLSMGKAITFSCSRIAPESNSCQLTTKSLLGTKVQSWNIQEIQKAKADTTTVNAANSHPLIIQTNRGSVELDFLNADFADKEAKAAQINTFLNTPQESKLVIAEDMRLLGYAFGLFLIAGGAIGIVYQMMNMNIICIVDKNVGKITIDRKSWLGNEVLEAKLMDVVEIKLHTFQLNNTQSYNVSLKLRSGKSIYIATGSMFTYESATKTIENIASFANISVY
jgi:hypothetical protein